MGRSELFVLVKRMILPYLNNFKKILEFIDKDKRKKDS